MAWSLCECSSSLTEFANMLRGAFLGRSIVPDPARLAATAVLCRQQPTEFLRVSSSYAQICRSARLSPATSPYAQLQLRESTSGSKELTSAAAYWRPLSREMSTKSKGKPQLSFKLAKKLLKLRPRQVPHRHRLKRGMMMNFAEYAVRRPFESHWEMYVTHRLGEAQASLDRIFVDKLKLGVIEPTPSHGPKEDPVGLQSVADIAGPSDLKDVYAKAGGDCAKLVELMEAKQSES